MEAWLSQNHMEFSLRDVVEKPLTEDEFAILITDLNGRTRVPFTRVGNATVLGYDPLRFKEYRESDPSASVVAYVRPGEASSERLLAYLRAERVSFAVRDIDAEPLALHELWELLTIPGRNVRTPYTVVGDEVILGYDIPRLKQALGVR